MEVALHQPHDAIELRAGHPAPVPHEPLDVPQQLRPHPAQSPEHRDRVLLLERRDLSSAEPIHIMKPEHQLILRLERRDPVRQRRAQIVAMRPLEMREIGRVRLLDQDPVQHHLVVTAHPLLPPHHVDRDPDRDRPHPRPQRPARAVCRDPRRATLREKQRLSDQLLDLADLAVIEPQPMERPGDLRHVPGVERRQRRLVRPRTRARQIQVTQMVEPLPLDPLRRIREKLVLLHVNPGPRGPGLRNRGPPLAHGPRVPRRPPPPPPGHSGLILFNIVADLDPSASVVKPILVGTMSSDRRRLERVPVLAEVEVVHDGRVELHFALDLSEGGAFLSARSDESPWMTPGVPVALSISIADGPDQVIFARGRVAWRQDESASDLPGIGIVFDEMTDANRATLRRMIADAKADAGDE